VKARGIHYYLVPRQLVRIRDERRRCLLHYLSSSLAAVQTGVTRMERTTSLRAARGFVSSNSSEAFIKIEKKVGAAVGEDAVLRFIHFACHNSTVGIYEHDFATMKDRIRYSRAKSVNTNWQALDTSFETAFASLSPAENPKNFVEWIGVFAVAFITRPLGGCSAISAIASAGERP
jgi:hypothetical protein